MVIPVKRDRAPVKKGIMSALFNLLAGEVQYPTGRSFIDKGSPIYFPPRGKLKGWQKKK